MALQVVGATLKISRADIDKYPGSLLASLIDSSTSSRNRVSFKVDALPDSLFATWPAAVGITRALYRQGYINAETLSELLTRHTTANLYDRLEELIDYLMLPGPVTDYLPAREEVSLPYASALDLYYQAAVNDAVETIMDSTTFSDPAICKDIGSQRAAFFYLSIKPDSTSLVSVQAYAVGDSTLSSWRTSLAADPMKVPRSAVAVLLPQALKPWGPVDNKVPLSFVVRSATNCSSIVMSMIRKGLKRGLAARAAAGSPMQLAKQSVLVADFYGPDVEAVLWVVHW